MLDANVDVYASRAARLGPAVETHFLEQCFYLERNSSNVIPAHTGSRVEINAQFVWVIEIVALSDRRGGAADAAKLYRETAASLKAREELLQQRRAEREATPQFPGRPTKRQRRKLEDFLNEP